MACLIDASEAVYLTDTDGDDCSTDLGAAGEPKDSASCVQQAKASFGSLGSVPGQD